MSRAKKPEQQPWLRYLILPFILILFGLFVSYAILAQQKRPTPLLPPTTATPTPTPTPNRGYVCPTTPWVDCMPGPDRPRSYQCTAEFLNWAKTNCSGFEGSAL